MRHVSSSRTLLIAALLLLLPTAPAVAQDAPPAATPGPPTVAQSWTARILFPTNAFAAPGGRKIATLRHYTTWSQGPAALLVTDYTTVDGVGWARVLLPARPNGKQAWVRADAVDLAITRNWVRVSTKARTVEVFVGGKLKKRLRVAVGTGGTPTPKGLAAVQDKVPTSGQLGPYILVLTAHSNVLKTFAGGRGEIGIHGWPTSAVLGKAVSHGCVRMSRSGVSVVAKYAPAGTPVEVI